MIQIKFFGGAKKLFQSGSMTLDKSDISLDELWRLLQKKSTSAPMLNIENTLIAINGIDSSALDGHATILKNNDIISIIPIVHGGSFEQLRFVIMGKQIQVSEIQGKNSNGIDLLDSLRREFPKLILQAVSSRFVLDRYHLEKIIHLSLDYEKNNMLLSNRFETDLLMRFAISGQISDAIRTAGIKPEQDFLLIAIGDNKNLEKLANMMPCKIPAFAKNNSTFLKMHFHLTQKQLDSVYSRNPLGDLLVERAATLFR